MTVWQCFKKQFKLRHIINCIVIAAIIATFFVLTRVTTLPRKTLSMFTQVGYSMILAVSLNLVVGFLGELSLGHAGFMCIGAYIGAYFSNLLEPTMGNGLAALLVCMVLGGVVAAFIGLLIGIPVLRLKGDYLAITTLAFGEIIRNIMKNLPFFGGAKGTSVNLYSQTALPVVTWIVLLVMIILIQNLIRSKHGRAITAIRDNEIAARAMGVHVTFYKLLAFVLAAFFAGVAGVIYAKSCGTVRQENFSYSYSIEILVMVVLGGIGSLNGSMIAAGIITFLNIELKGYLNGPLAPLKPVLYGLILILIILFTNAPAFARIRSRISLKSLWRKIRRKDESIIRPDEADWSKIPTKISMDEILSVDIKDTTEIKVPKEGSPHD